MALISGIIVAAASSATSLIWQSGMETALDKRIVVALLEGAVTTGMCIVFNQAVEPFFIIEDVKCCPVFHL